MITLSMGVSVAAEEPYMVCYCHTGYDKAMALMSRHGDALFCV